MKKKGSKMKLGIMQPYFMPYIGYWQLMNTVDTYVIYDDVNYIKGGWINRNQILINGKAKYLTIPVLGASPNKTINEIKIDTNPKIIDKKLRMIKGAYQKAPYYKETIDIIEKILTYQEADIVKFLQNSFKTIKDYLRIKTDFILSSNINKEERLQGQDKVLDICKRLGAKEYYNAIGGYKLYSFSDFEEENIRLRFLKTNRIEYKQFNNDFQKNLSIIDVMMFNSRETVIGMLDQYTVISDGNLEELKL